MSYDIYLTGENGSILESTTLHDHRGGTYALGGTTDLAFNITYNYADHFKRVLGEKGIRSLYGTTGAASIPVLEKAVIALCNDTDPDYWKPTEGNAKRALYVLLAFARERPDGIWQGD